MKHHKSRPTGRHRAPSAPVIAAGTLTALVVATFATAGIAVAAPQPGVTGPAPGQPGVTAPSPSPSPSPAPAPAPSTEPVPEPVYWVPPPAEYQNIPQQPLPNWDYDSGTYDAPADYSVAPVDYSNIHLPGPVEIVAPIIAPKAKGRIGDFVFEQKTWMSDQDLERTNNTSGVIESQVATFYKSIGIPVDRASRIAAAQLGGGAAGTLAGIVAVGGPASLVGCGIGGTVGGTSALGLFSPIVTPIGAVPAGVVGTVTGCGVGALALGAPLGALGGLGGGIAGVAAATAYGAGELGEPVDVSDQIPDIDQPAVTTQTQNTLTDWENSGPVGQAVATTVRDTVAAAPAIDQQARDFVAAQPGGEQIIEQVDTALTDFFTNASPGLASQLISDAIGAGTQA